MNKNKNKKPTIVKQINKTTGKNNLKSTRFKNNRI
jgi:hypothetical protein